MKKEIADKWVKALRSGSYEQTKRRLRDSHGYCCLGVLCDLAKEENQYWVWKSERGNDHFLFCAGESINSCDLGEDVRKWAQMSLSNENVNTLMTMNDGKKGTWDIEPKNFAEIADWIETNWQLI